MAIIVLVQSCMPCTDVFANKPVKASAEITKTRESKEANNECCSPFCQCACCAGFTFTFYPVPSITPVPEVCPQYTELNTRSIIEVSLPIWQPPQL